MPYKDYGEPQARLRPSTPALSPALLPERLQPWFDTAKSNLAAAFVGVTTNGDASPNLFPLAATGTTVTPLIEAASAFLEALSDEERRQATLDADSNAWRSWNNMHFFAMRHGLCLAGLGDMQRALALDLMRVTLSDTAFATARDIMRLNEHLSEITGRQEEFGEWYYWLAILGSPASGEPWGWQLDGHHLTVSAFVCGDQLVVTPTFMGSEPVYARSGKYAGVSVFQTEEALGLAAMKALDLAAQQKATIGTKIPKDVYAGSTFDNLVMPYQGICYREMSESQQRAVMRLVEHYVGWLRPEHAACKLAEVSAHLSETYFGWIGEHTETSVFYYRLHSPVVLIEFAHQAGVALVNPEPTRGHIHTIVRTPNGNDFGQALLQQYRSGASR
jgi:hypothetical protein